MLYEIAEFSSFEIAELLGVPRGTVASRLRFAREAFREAAGRMELTLRREQGSGDAMKDPKLLGQEGATDFERRWLSAARAEEPPPELVNRIERALGLGSGAAATQAARPAASRRRAACRRSASRGCPRWVSAARSASFCCSCGPRLPRFP